MWLRLIPTFDRLVRLFSRELPSDKLQVADDQIDWAKKHGIIDADDEPELARELAPRRMRRAFIRMNTKHDFAGDKHLPLDDAPKLLLPPRSDSAPRTLPRGPPDVSTTDDVPGPEGREFE